MDNGKGRRARGDRNTYTEVGTKSLDHALVPPAAKTEIARILH